jgi:anthranilate synthase component I
MHFEPSAATFAARYAAGEPQVVWTRFVSDLETPVSAFLKIAGTDATSWAAANFLLESVEGGEARGRYSIIGLRPDLVFRIRSGSAEINRMPLRDAKAFVPATAAPLQAIRALIAESRIDLPEMLPSMAAGVFGYLGYDVVRLMEDSLGAFPPDPFGLPDAVLVRPTLVIVFDAVEDTMTVVTPVRPQPSLTAETALAGARQRLATLIGLLDRAAPRPPSPLEAKVAGEPSRPGGDHPLRSNTPAEEFKRMVLRAKEYIAAGDIFQVVLSQRFEAPFPLPPFALYRALRRVNPSPYLYFLDFGDFAIAGSSPEILVKARGGIVTIRPIAGTRRRGATVDEDKALEAELLADPKERAEHLMLLDLGRNDVGRVAEIGSVRVTEQFAIERYSQVMHIVSNVEGNLREGCDALDALVAGFPAGTVSGAPKVRAMQIIDELEKEKRSLYAGCVGYFSAGAELDTCIVLRTAVLKDGMMYVQAGAGIVADSDPESEQQECLNKAKALFRAAEEARRFAAAARPA